MSGLAKPLKGVRVRVKDSCDYFPCALGTVIEVRMRGRLPVGVVFEGVPDAGTMPWYFSHSELDDAVE